eukprot:890954-Pelagomonas_calceolata.AAC.3
MRTLKYLGVANTFSDPVLQQIISILSTSPVHLFFGEAPFMGREPLDLTPSGKVYTRLPRPTQHTPNPGNLATLPNKTAWQPCSVRGAWEAGAGAVLGLIQPAYYPP